MNLAAVFPPMATPFRDGKVDAPSIVFNVERWIHAGTGGVVALGSNGEAPFLSEEESDRVIAAAREGVPRDKTLIAGTGREGTPATIDATRRAASLGADAALVRTPSFFKGRMTPDAFVRHYTAVADASPVPVLLYNFTAVTGVNITADAVARLAEHPNIAGIKESGSDMAQVSAFLDATPRASFAVIAGSAPTLFPALALGALGAILAVAGVAPELCVRIYDAVRAGRYDEARELQKRLTPLARLVTTAHGVPGLKAAMDLAGYRGGPPRMPLTPAPPEAVDQIRAELAHLREAV
ncbi:MAG: hypothetical protein A3H96_17450 [Acidobacteria bacterium RIFCSPLOWO2_02_FULL_67_36]|nr:MAG: hypothetical protein A3H96_17450 [Acidobacteria bacterium RIFCSPLOWO2_02_FULL_67_36]OFW25801.1 MAG: hypothetical protein A3G21_25335 [Acidobacteria bacterium RIFCSPLOWO2_12_FULL_66_21]